MWLKGQDLSNIDCSKTMTVTELTASGSDASWRRKSVDELELFDEPETGAGVGLVQQPVLWFDFGTF